MVKYESYELQNLTTRLSSGKNISSDKIQSVGNYPVFGGNGIRGYTSECNFNGECVIIGRQGAFCGNVRYYNGQAYMTEHAVVLCTNQKANARYLYYYLSLQNLGRLSGQSAQPGLSVKVLGKQQVQIPNLEYQQKIAKILSALDEKIELNNKINENLHAQAQAIFKSWFVDFEPFGGTMPNDWEKGKLGDVVKVCYGKDHKKLENGVIPAYGSGGIIRYVEQFLYDKESVLIPRKGTLNNVFYMNEPFWTVDTMFYTEMKKEYLAKFIFYFVKGLNLESMNVGSAVPSMTTAILNSIEIFIPTEQILKNFDTVIVPLFNLIKNNDEENKKLAQIRDTLLPKLMSGELEV